MNKQDFLQELRNCLHGELNEQAINGHVNYYQNYINEQISQGNSEDDVMALLGDPRLIAKTIIETKDAASEQQAGYQQSESYQTYDNGPEPPKPSITAKFKRTLILVGIVAIVLIVISTIFRIVSIFLPVILILVILSVIFNGNKR